MTVDLLLGCIGILVFLVPLLAVIAFGFGVMIDMERTFK